MSKYRGSDGWLNDDGVTRRYHSQDKTKPRETAADSTPKRPKLDRCPNCTFTIYWRVVEGYCKHCGWGKKDSDWAGWTPPVTSDGGVGLACCGMVGVSAVLSLVLMGMGYGFGGFGGMIAGLGLGLAAPVGLIIAASMTGKKKENPPGDQTS